MRWLVLAAVITLALTSSEVRKVEMRWPGWGFTHTPSSVLGRRSPEPAPGVYRFASLDHRIDFIRQAGGIPVITLCCAPDWMKGGTPGQTNWNRLTAAPLPEHYADFAALSGVIARRYPDVGHFLVWNEFKGFFDEENNRWDAEAYTDLYNEVYEAVKAVNPLNRIGGPYLDMASPPSGTTGQGSSLRGPWGTVDQGALDAFDYWLAHKRGADFVVVDGHTTDGDDPDEFAALEKLSAVGWWIRARTELPLWWAQWYVEPAGSRISASARPASDARGSQQVELACDRVDRRPGPASGPYETRWVPRIVP